MITKPASDFTAEQLATCFNSAFEGYIAGPVNFTADSVTKYMKNNLYSLENSHVMVDEETGNLIAFAHIATREDVPTISRLASFGVVPAFKGKGIGTKLVHIVKEAEAARGVKILELECVSGNAPAVALYKKHGFTILRELYGWERGAVEPEEFEVNDELEETTLDEIRKGVREWGAEDIPWQAWMVDGMPGKNLCYKLDQAYCMVAMPEKAEDPIKMRSFVVDPEARGKGQARGLAKAVLAKYPGRSWAVPAIYPKEFGHTLAGELGFADPKLFQYQMRVTL